MTVKRPARQTAIRAGGNGTARRSTSADDRSQEFHAAATRKLGIEPVETQRRVEFRAQGHAVRMKENDVVRAIEPHRPADCKLLYTEDLQHGAVIGGVRMANPFAAGGPPGHRS